MSRLDSVRLLDTSLSLTFENGTSVAYEDCWLRDNCRCSSCYNADNFQRALHLLEIPDVRIDSFFYDKKLLKITWSDDHQSIYNAEFLAKFIYDRSMTVPRHKPVMWRGAEVANKIKRVHVDKFSNTVDGAKAVFKSLLDYGVAFIENVDASVGGTEKVCTALGGVQRTMYGEMWRISTEPDHADSGFTNLPLNLHNDLTYYNEAPGLEILQCLQHPNGSGGETLLVDGFYGATRLRNEHPEDYDFLTNFDVEAEYIEDGHHYRFSAPVIRLDKVKDITQIRFNAYDRATMAFSSGKECKAYYRSLRNLSRYYENPEYQWQFKLKPGIVLVMDNFRILHGRTGYTGDRIMCGSYVSRSDWLNKARVLRLIN